MSDDYKKKVEIYFIQSSQVFCHFSFGAKLKENAILFIYFSIVFIFLNFLLLFFLPFLFFFFYCSGFCHTLT